MKIIEMPIVADFIEKIRKFNLLPLFLTNLYLAVISTFYVYVAATSLIALPLLALTVSLLIGAANLLIALIVSYNTLAARNPKSQLKKTTVKQQNKNLNIFLAFAIPAFALNFITNLVGPYISLPLVGSALSLPISSPWFMGICIFIGAFTAIAFGLYNIVQIYEACQRIKPVFASLKEEPHKNGYIPLSKPRTANIRDAAYNLQPSSRPLSTNLSPATQAATP